jgi:hypothetical protein
MWRSLPEATSYLFRSISTSAFGLAFDPDIESFLDIDRSYGL